MGGLVDFNLLLLPHCFLVYRRQNQSLPRRQEEVHILERNRVTNGGNQQSQDQIESYCQRKRTRDYPCRRIGKESRERL